MVEKLAASPIKITYMSSVKRGKHDKRFVGIPWRVVQSPQFASLKSSEVKLLIDLLTQRNGENNGSLTVSHAVLKKRGWATSSLYRAYCSLVYKGFLIVTRQGWKVRGRATMVAITWLGIDEPNKFSYDEGVKPDATPLGYWCKDKSYWKHLPTLKPPEK